MKKVVLGMLICFPILVLAQIKTQQKIETTHYCYDTEKILQILSSEFKEIPLFMGDAEDIAESTMSIWVSKQGTTWTIVATKDDLSCIVGSGKNFQVVRKGKSI